MVQMVYSIRLLPKTMVSAGMDGLFCLLMSVILSFGEVACQLESSK